jgi:hypothetical protein
MRSIFSRREWLLVAICLALLAAWWADRAIYARRNTELGTRLDRVHIELRHANEQIQLMQRPETGVYRGRRAPAAD